MPTRLEELATKTLQLAEVRDAIAAVLRRGQQVGAESAEVRRAELEHLSARERTLEGDVRILSRGGGLRVTRVVPR
jgi:hypothetical protein